MWDEVLINEGQDVVAELVELLFDFGPVLDDELGFVAFSGLSLLDGGKGSPSRSSGSNGVFVSDGEEVSLFFGKIATEFDDLFHEIEHILESLSLFSELGLVDQVFTGHCF